MPYLSLSEIKKLKISDTYNIDKYKINMDGFVGMSDVNKCPNCGNDIYFQDIIGWGEYPKNNSRFNSDRYGIAYECSNCFEKQCHHIGLYEVIAYMEVKFG